MKNKINLNKEVSIDIPKLIEGGMVILANSGGGKSYAIRKIAEEANGQVQTIILDPEGEFASLREKYDFILAGKNADVPVEVRSASLLATRLLELGKSAVIDLYELHPSERQRYVKLFCDALVNCSKELYHPVLIILDEAHEYVPEGKPSEATWSVESLASKGRKRGQRLILASQRISKLSKNASAECNNKLIGRASQDIDMKRAGDELGFTKEKLKELRQLKPGEFFAFGSAISDEVIKLKIGEVKTAHAKVGYKGSMKTPPPSAVIKKILGELKDLPQEAEKELKTVSELKAKIVSLQKQKPTIETKIQYETDPKIVHKAVQEVEKKYAQRIKAWKKYAEDLMWIITHAEQTAHNAQKPKDEELIAVASSVEIAKFSKTFEKEIAVPDSVLKKGFIFEDGNKTLSKGAKAILSYLESVYPQTKTKAQIWIATGYAPGGGFNNLMYELTGKGLIQKSGDNFLALECNNEDFDTSFIKWQAKLSKGAWSILQFLLETPNQPQDKSIIAEQTHYALGGGFNNLVYELSGKEFIKKVAGGYIINPEILDL